MYHYSEQEDQKPTFISPKETAIQPKKETKPEDHSEDEAFAGQKEAKQASYDSFKFAVDHDPKEEYLAKNNFLQNKDQIALKEDTPPVAAPKKEEAKKLDEKQIE